MIRIDEVQSGKDYRLVLTPNCSISWRQLLVFYLGTCCLAIIIGLIFSLHGKWLVLPFSGLEMMALASALYITSRKVHCREVITAKGDHVKIEKGMHRNKRQWIFERCWVGLLDETTDEQHRHRRIALGSHGSYVEVGDFLSDFEKDELAFRLKDCIIRA